MRDQDSSTKHENRRGFVRKLVGVGAGLAATPSGNSLATPSGKVHSPGTSEAGLSEYERILSHTDRMHILGNPRSWSLVTQGLHPFAPERVVVLPSGKHFRYGDRCGRDLRRQFDKQIDVDYDQITGVDPQRWFPESKRESIYWMMDAMTGHYGVSSLFEHWVVGLAGREILGQTAFEGMGLAHQYQQGGEVAVNNPPFDWWLFLYPDGYDWGSLDEKPVFAIICHVAQHKYTFHGTYASMLPLWGLTQNIWGEVKDWGEVARMGRVGACRHLNGVAARCLANMAV